MKVILASNLVFYSILLIAFVQSYEAFDLTRHGLNFSGGVVAMAGAYYGALMVYLIVHRRKQRIVLDPYNMFLLLFSVLIIPGIITAGQIHNSIVPHLFFLFTGLVFVGVGILFEILSPGSARKFYLTEFRHSYSNTTILTFLVIYLFLVGAVFVSGNMNRSGSFNIILEFISQSQIADISAVARYREEVYHVWGLKQVIGNYAGGVFAPFIALILFTDFMRRGDRRGNIWLKIIGLLILAFPISFAIGSGSRLILLRTILIYLVFFSLPFGIRLFDKRVLHVVAFIFTVLILSTSVLGRGIQGATFFENLVIQTEKSIVRLFLGKGGSTMVVYEYYPYVEDFENGIPILESLLGIQLNSEPSVAVKIFAYLTNGSLGTAGPQTFGDLYASFGYLGQLIFTIILACIFLSLRVLYGKSIQKNTLERALWAFLIVSIGYLGYSDVASFKRIGFMYVLAFYVLLRLFMSRRVTVS